MDRIWQWFSASPSGFLLVHVNLADASNDYGRTSSLFVVCSTIASAIAKQSNSDITTLYYFCGLHMSSFDDIKGPQGLIRCLRTRLIVRLKAKYDIVANMDFLDVPYVDGLRRRDIVYLCAAFRSILAQFPPNATVYCILDGVSWYEGTEMLNNLFSVVRSLYDTVDNRYRGPVLKVLLTSPFRSLHNASSISLARQISLEPGAMLLEEVSERVLFSTLDRVILW